MVFSMSVGAEVAPASLGDPTASVVPVAQILHPGDQVAHLGLPHSQPSHHRCPRVTL